MPAPPGLVITALVASQLLLPILTLLLLELALEITATSLKVVGLLKLLPFSPMVNLATPRALWIVVLRILLASPTTA
jgi:hypothetical protein